jgi:hypothetical protein
MGDWFMAGGWGMISLTVLGLGSVVVGVLAALNPTKGKLAVLRSLPELLMFDAVFAFGTNMWAVYVHLSNDEFVKARSITGDQLPFLGIIGITESVQTLTLGGLLAMLVVVLRMVAESRAVKAAP